MMLDPKHANHHSDGNDFSNERVSEKFPKKLKFNYFKHG
jgi:hypothetical protein